MLIFYKLSIQVSIGLHLVEPKMSFRFVLFGLCCGFLLTVANGQSDITTQSPVGEKKEESGKKLNLHYLAPGVALVKQGGVSATEPYPPLSFRPNQTDSESITTSKNLLVTEKIDPRKAVDLGPREILQKEGEHVKVNIGQSRSDLKSSSEADAQKATVKSASGINNAAVNKTADVCYPAVGCFEMGGPWKTRPVPAPGNPAKMRTTIFSYSRENLKNPVRITIYPEIRMKNASYNSSRKTVIIVHGFKSSGNVTWSKDIKDVYLQEVDANAMIVDWGYGASEKYFQVAGNTRVIGKQVALLVKHLIHKYGANPADFHLIGHSLGAQICSYVGKQVPGIGHITALDPAQPGFEGHSERTRLVKSDAKFVEVIHTDARPFKPGFGFGMIAPHGHVDFYMNGGFDQPGCYAPLKRNLLLNAFRSVIQYPVNLLTNWISCSHGRAYYYYIEAINSKSPCVLMGYRANTKNMYRPSKDPVKGLIRKLKPISTNCDVNDCLPMGLNTDKTSLRGVFVVKTAEAPPYCKLDNPNLAPITQYANSALRYAKLIGKIVKYIN